MAPDFKTCKIQVIVNVATLIEGYDCQIVSCVIILRPNSFPSTIKQMMGRGLRIVDSDEHPNIIKKDCFVLDFFNSEEKYKKILLEPIQYLNHPKNQKSSESNTIKSLPSQTKNKKTITLDNYTLVTQISLTKSLKLPPFCFDKNTLFKWEPLHNNIIENIYMASGFHSFALIAPIKDDIWYSWGGCWEEKTKKIKCIKILTIGLNHHCFASANDWLNEHEEKKIYREMHWTKNSPTDRQLYSLQKFIEKDTFSPNANVDRLKKLTKYQASVWITYFKYKPDIDTAIKKAQEYKKTSLNL
ncbi:helicase-related protein [Candidatus Phytoplasma australasiaticum]